MEPKKVKNIGYKLGEVFTIVVAICLCSLVVAATLKLIMFMF